MANRVRFRDSILVLCVLKEKLVSPAGGLHIESTQFVSAFFSLVCVLLFAFADNMHLFSFDFSISNQVQLSHRVHICVHIEANGMNFSMRHSGAILWRIDALR